jgi:hypothetical protein
LEIVEFFGTKWTVFCFHFQIYAALQLAPAHEVDREAVEAFATKEIIQCLQSDELSMSAQYMRD